MATTEQLMAQYGVAWFDFDETGGNVIDKIGLSDYIGIVTGATRTQGWNGEGGSMNFSGATVQRVQFNQKIIPIGEKSIRLKYKIDSLPSTNNRYLLLSNNSYDATKYGIEFTIHPDGSFRVWIRTQATLLLEIVAPISAIPDGKWHDVLFTWDGTVTAKGVKLYIDDMTQPKVVSQARAQETVAPSDNLVLGNVSTLNSAQNNVFYVGQLDDVQIYNKDISSMLVQKRLVVKTKDNKNLSVLNGRAKEVPNINESTLLEQGRIIREIDGAVDAQPVDLIFNSTQYEITNNTNTPLGSNKVFSLPINKEFKTIVIEDNY